MRVENVICVAYASFFAAMAIVACATDPFVGPATTPIACPVRCAAGGCCDFGWACRDFPDGGMCEYEGDDFIRYGGTRSGHPMRARTSE